MSIQTVSVSIFDHTHSHRKDVLKSFTRLTAQLIPRPEGQVTSNKIREASFLAPNAVAIAKMPNVGIVGMAYLSVTQRPTSMTAEIHSVVVDQEHRRKKVGSMLVEKLIEEARSVTVEKIHADCPIGVVAAEEFFKKLGFRLTHNGYTLALSP